MAITKLSDVTMTAAESAGKPAAPARPLDVAGLVREHGVSVWRTLRRMGVAEGDLDDACQEVFLVAHRRAGDFEGRANPRTWLIGIALRLAANYRRKRRSTTADVDVYAHELSGDEGGSPEDVLTRKEARVLLQGAVDALDDDKRAVFVLFEIEELPMAEVAHLVGCPLQTAYSRLHAARAAIQRAFAEEGGGA